MPQPRVFVSHSHRDSVHTQQLVEDLRAEGAEVWVDVAKIQHGDFMQRISDGLSKSDWLVLVQTPNSLRSQYVQAEVNAAIKLVFAGRLAGVIPFIVEPCDEGEIPPLWSTLHGYDATKDYDTAFEALLTVLQQEVHLQPTGADPLGSDAAKAARITLPGGLSIPRIGRRAFLASTAVTLTGVAAAGAGFILSKGHLPLFAPSSSHTSSNNNDPSRRLIWSKQTRGAVHATPVLVDDVLYLATDSGDVQASYSETGSELWHFPTGASITIPLTVYAQVVFAITSSSRLYALDQSLGSLRWPASQTPGQVYGALVPSGGFVYFSTTKGSIESIDISLGGVNFTSDRRYAVSPPTILGTQAFMGSSKNAVIAIDTAYGYRQWSTSTKGGVVSSPAAENNIVYATSLDHNVYAMRTDLGTVLWRYSTGGPINSSPVIVGDKLLVSSGDNNLYVLDKAKGSLLWRYPLGSTGIIVPDNTGDLVFIVTNDDPGSVHAVDIKQLTQRWQYTAQAAIHSAPILGSETIYCSSLDGSVYALNSANGALRWKYSTKGQVACSPLYDSIRNAVYVASLDGNIYALTA